MKTNIVTFIIILSIGLASCSTGIEKNMNSFIGIQKGMLVNDVKSFPIMKNSELKKIEVEGVNYNFLTAYLITKSESETYRVPDNFMATGTNGSGFGRDRIGSGTKSKTDYYHLNTPYYFLFKDNVLIYYGFAYEFKVHPDNVFTKIINEIVKSATLNK